MNPYSFQVGRKTCKSASQPFSVITIDPNSVVEPLHNRMPVTLPERDYSRWLDVDSSQLPMDLLRPYEADQMTAWEASRNEGAVATVAVFALVRENHRELLVGYLGMPRRYHAYPPEFQVLNVLSTAGASILAIGYLLPAVYLVWSLKYGEVAGNNPWRATGLEWQTQSPPLTENFTEVPVVTEEAYDYGKFDRPVVVTS